MAKVNIIDYIKADEEEITAKNSSIFSAYEALQQKNRGTYFDSKGREHVRIRAFLKYSLKKRVDLFRVLTTNEYYLKNQKTKAYERVSEIFVGTALIRIMDEYKEYLYEEAVFEPELFNLLPKICSTYEKLEASNEYILFPNGVFSLNDYTFDRDFIKDGIFTYVMPYDYEPDAVCPVFLEALNKIFAGDNERITLIQEILGYTFAYGEAPADKMPYLWGRGRNGKSLLDDVIRKMHGSENVSAVSLNKLSERFQLAELFGKRVNLCPEAPMKKLMNTSMLKAMTGGDAVVVERKYMNPFTAELDCKILASSNHYLRTQDASLGFWERILPVPFDVTFLSKEELPNGEETTLFRLGDPELNKKIQPELEGIFLWAIEGLKRLKGNGWVFSPCVASDKLKEQMILLNKPIEVFVKRCVVPGNLNKEKGDISAVSTSDTHEKFLAFCNANDIDAPDYIQAKGFHKGFRETLTTCGIPFKTVKKSIDFYVGFTINKEYLKMVD